MAESNYDCKICDVPCNSFLALEQHKEGRKHKNKMLALGMTQASSQPQVSQLNLQLQLQANLAQPSLQHQPQVSLSHQPQGSLSHQPQGSFSHQAPGSSSYQVTGSLSYQAPGSLSHQAPGSLSHQSPGSSSYQAPGSLSHQAPGSLSHQPKAIFPQHQPSPSLPPQQQQQPAQSYCDTCACNVPGGPVNWQTHLSGQQHNKKLNEKRVPSTALAADIANSAQAASSASSVTLDPCIAVIDNTKQQYKCRQCDAPLSGVKAVNEHCASAKHKVKCAQPASPAQLQPSSSTNARPSLASQLQSLKLELVEAAKSGWLNQDRMSADALAHNALSPRDVSRCSTMEELLIRLATANRLDVALNQLPKPDNNPAAGSIERARLILESLVPTAS